MPEVRGADGLPNQMPTPAEIDAMFAAMPPFTCAACHTPVEEEPRCEHCGLCLACCTCEPCPGGGHMAATLCHRCGVCSRRRDAARPCCGCQPCARCHTPNPPSRLCPQCHLCLDGRCCMCWTCPRCHARHSRASGSAVRPCAICSACLACCSCRGLRWIAAGPPVFHLTPVGEADTRAENQRLGPPMHLRRNNPSHRFLSTEIEVSAVRSGSNINTARVVSRWGGAIVGDGSLGSGGFEINTAPAAGDVFGIQIEEICAALDRDQAYANSNAGAHVHIDARDFRFYDIRRLVFLYEKLEGAIYGLTAPHRANNHFSLPCGTLYSRNLRAGRVPKATKVILLKNLYALDGNPDKRIKSFKRDKGAPNRYHGLNLHSWMFRGTIECRIMHGSTNAERLTNWGYMWASILDAAMRMRESEILALTKPGIELLYDIASTAQLKQWIDNRWSFFHRNRR